MGKEPGGHVLQFCHQLQVLKRTKTAINLCGMAASTFPGRKKASSNILLSKK